MLWCNILLWDWVDFFVLVYIILWDKFVIMEVKINNWCGKKKLLFLVFNL